MMEDSEERNKYLVELRHVRSLDEGTLEKLYCWVDQIPLSRQKRYLERDFSDGVLVAEVIKYFLPKVVELHNYTTANATQAKEQNWYLLNRKVFHKLDLELSAKVIRALALCKPPVIEHVLQVLRLKIDLLLARKHNWRPHFDAIDNTDWQSTDVPESDQYILSGRQSEGGWSLSTDMQTTPATSRQPPSQVSGLPTGRRKPTTQTVPDFHSSPRIRLQKEMLPRTALEEKKLLIKQKQHMVEILQSKVQRLEHLLHLKDIRIEDLTARMDALEQEFPGLDPGPIQEQKSSPGRGVPSHKKAQGTGRQPPKVKWDSPYVPSGLAAQPMQRRVGAGGGYSQKR